MITNFGIQEEKSDGTKTSTFGSPAGLDRLSAARNQTYRQVRGKRQSDADWTVGTV